MHEKTRGVRGANIFFTVRSARTWFMSWAKALALSGLAPPPGAADPDPDPGAAVVEDVVPEDEVVVVVAAEEEEGEVAVAVAVPEVDAAVLAPPPKNMPGPVVGKPMVR